MQSLYSQHGTAGVRAERKASMSSRSVSGLSASDKAEGDGCGDVALMSVRVLDSAHHSLQEVEEVQDVYEVGHQLWVNMGLRRWRYLCSDG